MRILLTGATGVVGRRALPLLVEAGHEVTAVARSPEKAERVARAGASPLRLDLFDESDVREAVAGHDAVVNLATHIPAGSRAFLPGAWRENDKLRERASAILASAALEAGCERFLQESITLIYRDGGDRWITESDAVDPPAYARSVVAAEASASRLSARGRAGVVLRFSLFYGPDSVHTLEAVRFTRLGLAPTFGSADGYVSSLATDDAATAVVAALEAPAGIYNVTDDEPLRRREYVDSLARELGANPPRIPPTWATRLGGSLAATIARSQRVSNARFREATGWRPRFPSAREGWREVVRELG